MGTLLLDWLVDLFAPADKQRGPMDLLKLAGLIVVSSAFAVIMLGE